MMESHYCNLTTKGRKTRLRRNLCGKLTILKQQRKKHTIVKSYAKQKQENEYLFKKKVFYTS